MAKTFKVRRHSVSKSSAAASVMMQLAMMIDVHAKVINAIIDKVLPGNLVLGRVQDSSDFLLPLLSARNAAIILLFGCTCCS
eukprot:6209200-Pleurochrysis_carterae.AAC.6